MGNKTKARDSQRVAAAERMRRSRERHRDGYRTVLVDVEQDLAGRLVGLSLLAAEDAADPYAIGDAIGQFLEQELGNRGF